MWPPPPLCSAHGTGSGRHAETARELHAAVQDAVAQHASEVSDDRSTTLGLKMLGVLLIPFVWLAGYVLHTVVLS